MGEGHGANGFAIQPAAFRCFPAGGRQAFVEAPGQRAGLAVAGVFRVLAGLVAGHQFEHAQRLCPGLRQRIQGQLPTGCFRGEEEDLIQPLARHGLEQREQCAQGFADAGGRLGHQAAAGADGLVHRFGELALALAEFCVGETKGFEGGVARTGVGEFLFGPGDEARALFFEEAAQVFCAMTLDEQGFFLTADVEIHQRQFDFRQLLLLTEQPAIDLHLGPVQLPVIVRHALEVATVGLHLFQAVLRRVVAVGAAAYPQRPVLAAQDHFRLVALAAAGGDQGVAGDAFLGGGRRGEAQIEVATLGGELAERTHGDAVAHVRRPPTARSRLPRESRAGRRTPASATGCPADGRRGPSLRSGDNAVLAARTGSGPAGRRDWP
ncbi:hypothetical protein D9M72_409600 [compost metagenome]